MDEKTRRNIGRVIGWTAVVSLVVIALLFAVGPILFVAVRP